MNRDHEEWLLRQLARLDKAEELLGAWLDGLCPANDTSAFLTNADRPAVCPVHSEPGRSHKYAECNCTADQPSAVRVLYTVRRCAACGAKWDYDRTDCPRCARNADKPTTVQDKIASLPPERQERVNARAEELITAHKPSAPIWHRWDCKAPGPLGSDGCICTTVKS
jgi:hypothetical protein